MTRSRKLPPCALGMGCLCAFHAAGGAIAKPCDTNERWITTGRQRVRAARHDRARRNVERVLASAEAHGRASDDAGHEAGDLADFLRLLAREAPADAIELALTAYWNTHEEWAPTPTARTK